MKKKLFALLMAASLCVSLLCVPAFAAESVSGTYEDGVVDVTGSDYTPNANYNVTIIDNDGHVSSTAVQADENGNLSTSMTTGALDEDSLGGYTIVVSPWTNGTASTGPITAPEKHTHSYTGTETTPATCTTKGVMTYTCSCGDSYTEEIAALGHSYGEATVTKEATCGAAGTKTSTCSRCGDKKTETIPATGDHIWDSGTVTTAATSTTAGVKTYTCTVCGEKKTESIPATGSSSSGGSSGGSSSSDGYTVSVSSVSHGKVTVSPSSATKGTKVTLTVKPDDGYELADLVVTDKNGDEVDLTKVSDTKYTFTMPSGKVTVTPTFVKIEDGTPGDTTPTVTNPFVDVTVTRSQTVTFLYRYEGSPAVSGSIPFTDVSGSAYYANAVQWAVNNAVTTGTSATTFSPDMDCSRAQIVTFLYRDLVG